MVAFGAYRWKVTSIMDASRAGMMYAHLNWLPWEGYILQESIMHHGTRNIQVYTVRASRPADLSVYNHLTLMSCRDAQTISTTALCKYPPVWQVVLLIRNRSIEGAVVSRLLPELLTCTSSTSDSSTLVVGRKTTQHCWSGYCRNACRSSGFIIYAIYSMLQEAVLLMEGKVKTFVTI